MMENGYSLADIAAATGGTNKRDDNGFGGDGGWIWIILLFALFGFGGNGFGGLGGNGANGAGLQGLATRADINEGFALNGIERGIQSIQSGLCDSTYALTNGMNAGFSSAELSRCNQQAMLMQQLNNMSFQNQQCCCDVRGDIKDVMYAGAKNTCDIQNTIQNTTRDVLENNNANTRSILDFLINDKISTLTAENQTLKFQASQTAQNGFIDAVGNSIVARVQPAPVPAYTVPAPYPYGFNGCGCGCNSGCGC